MPMLKKLRLAGTYRDENLIIDVMLEPPSKYDIES
jgi:hypothetical protein